MHTYTKGAGALAYFGTCDIITSERLETIHDSVAAANGITLEEDNDQCVSYDDTVTLKQKVDWASSVGLDGVMI